MLQIGDLGKFYLCGRDDCLKHGFVSFLSGLNKSWEMNGGEDVIHSCAVAYTISFLERWKWMQFGFLWRHAQFHVSLEVKVQIRRMT